MDAERTQAMAEGDLRALGMSKKASKRFTSMLNRLATSTLHRVSSFGSMSSVNKRLSKSDRDSTNENFIDS
jgi:N-acetylglucosamine kinase-like BadF-type ATPase